MTDINNKQKVDSYKIKLPLLQSISSYQPVFWINNRLNPSKSAFLELEKKFPQLNELAIKDADARLERFSPLIVRLFPDTKARDGIIESNIEELVDMKYLLQKQYHQNFEGRLFLKCDSALPIAGSIKARGGIYEVLKHAENLAIGQGLLKVEDNYTVLAEASFKTFYSQYSLAVGSTGNLGLSIGIMGAALGFNTAVHMSKDAKTWKKELLRSKGVHVYEYESDYSKAVEEGRKQSMENPNSHFIDDENSVDLFLGYSVAALRLKEQLAQKRIIVDKTHPLFVYLPCGVGGAPGGICFGLKQIFGDDVHCFFVEPTHSPCMLIGLMTGENDKLSVFDFGLDNITEADGLAVGRASGFVGNVIETLISGIYTVQDDELYKLLTMLADSEKIGVEPSATPGLLGPQLLSGSIEGKEYLRVHGLEDHMKNAAHIAWATGGLFVPEALRETFYMKGKGLLEKK